MEKAIKNAQKIKIMGLLFGLLIPTLILFIPLTVLILIGRKSKRISRRVWVLAIIGCFLAGIIVPLVATSISISGLINNYGSDEPNCVTGAGVFLYFGFLLNVISIPIAGIVLFPAKKLLEVDKKKGGGVLI